MERHSEKWGRSKRERENNDSCQAERDGFVPEPEHSEPAVISEHCSIFSQIAPYFCSSVKLSHAVSFAK